MKTLSTTQADRLIKTGKRVSFFETSFQQHIDNVKIIKRDRFSVYLETEDNRELVISRDQLQLKGETC